MKKILIAITIACPFFSCNKLIDLIPGQAHPSSEFKNVYGGTDQDAVGDVVITGDGGYFLAASSQSTDGDVTDNHGDLDAWVVKLNKQGAIEWQKSFGGSSYEVLSSVVSNNSGGYTLAGLTTSTDVDATPIHGYYDGWIVSLDHKGELLWQKALGGSAFEDFERVVNCNDNGYVAVGATNSNDGDVSGLHGENEDGWIVKLNNSGEVAWQKTIGGTGSERFHDVIKTIDGGFVVVGHATSTDGDVHTNDGAVDGWVVKLDGQGNIEWEKTYGGTAEEVFTNLTFTWDGGFILVGTTTSDDGDVTNYHGEQDIWIVKIDPDGNLQWQKTLGGSNFETSSAIVTALNGTYLITAVTDSEDGDATGVNAFGDGWVVTIDGNGNILSQKTYGGSGTDVLTSIDVRWDGSYVAAGRTESNDGDVTGNHGQSDAWVLSVKP